MKWAGAGASPHINFNDFVDSYYLPDACARKRGWRLDARVFRNHLAPAFGKYQLGAIAAPQIQAWLHELALKGYKPASRNRFLAVLKAIFGVAEDLGFIADKRALFGRVGRLKRERRPECFLTAAKAARLVLYLIDNDCLAAKAIRLLLLTGARKNEILKAAWADIDLEGGILTVPLSKSGNLRPIALSQAAKEIIRSLPGPGFSPWLFPGRNPLKPLADIYAFWNSVRKALGLNGVRVHDLRHTYASLLVNSGFSLYAAQKALGHASPATTMRYAHFNHATILACAEAVSGLLASEAGRLG